MCLQKYDATVYKQRPGPQGRTSPHIVKDCLPIISQLIKCIINGSLISGTFPHVWKKAEVIPIPKEGDHKILNNKKPFSLLPLLSKVCEKVALNQLITYPVANSQLSTKQNRTKKWHSTETALIHTTDQILPSMDKKELTAMVLLDMSKAFDSINHSILLMRESGWFIIISGHLLRLPRLLPGCNPALGSYVG